MDKKKFILYATPLIIILFILFDSYGQTEKTSTFFPFETNVKTADSYNILRNHAINAGDEYLSSDNECSVYSAVVDVNEGNGIMTLACYIDGTTSLLYSSGGVLGLGQQEEFRNATIGFLNYASEVLDELAVVQAYGIPEEMSVIEPYGFPSEGHQMMYFITSTGVYLNMDFSTPDPGSKGKNIDKLNSLYYEIMDQIYNSELFLAYTSELEI